MPDFESIILQLMNEGEEISGEELDDRFLALTIVLGLTRETQDLAYRGWLKVTDIQQPQVVRLLTEAEWDALGLLCTLIREGQKQ